MRPVLILGLLLPQIQRDLHGITVNFYTGEDSWGVVANEVLADALTWVDK